MERSNAQIIRTCIFHTSGRLIALRRSNQKSINVSSRNLYGRASKTYNLKSNGILKSCSCTFEEMFYFFFVQMPSRIWNKIVVLALFTCRAHTHTHTHIGQRHGLHYGQWSSHNQLHHSRLDVSTHKLMPLTHSPSFTQSAKCECLTT